MLLVQCNAQIKNTPIPTLHAECKSFFLVLSGKSAHAKKKYAI